MENKKLARQMAIALSFSMAMIVPSLSRAEDACSDLFRATTVITASSFQQLKEGDDVIYFYNHKSLPNPLDGFGSKGRIIAKTTKNEFIVDLGTERVQTTVGALALAGSTSEFSEGERVRVNSAKYGISTATYGGLTASGRVIIPAKIAVRRSHKIVDVYRVLQTNETISKIVTKATTIDSLASMTGLSDRERQIARLFINSDIRLLYAKAAVHRGAARKLFPLDEFIGSSKSESDLHLVSAHDHPSELATDSLIYLSKASRRYPAGTKVSLRLYGSIFIGEVRGSNLNETNLIVTFSSPSESSGRLNIVSINDVAGVLAEK